MPYHNTTHEIGNTLKRATETAYKQDSVILQYFLDNRPTLGASKVHAALLKEGHNILLTSTRRALTGLSKKGDLIVGSKAMGAYGMVEFQYSINPAKHPTITGTEQQSLF